MINCLSASSPFILILSPKFFICGDVYENATDALQAAKDNAGLNDVIIACGSFFVVAELPD